MHVVQPHGQQGFLRNQVGIRADGDAAHLPVPRLLGLVIARYRNIRFRGRPQIAGEIHPGPSPGKPAIAIIHLQQPR
jgi:hypothetical protein